MGTAQTFEVSLAEPDPTPVSTAVTLSPAALIAMLDADRSYEPLGYDGLVKGINDGTVLIKPPFPGGSQPVLTDAVTGRRLKGSGMPDQRAAAQGPRAWQRARFLERASEDFDSVYDALVDVCVNEKDPRAMKLFLELAIGPTPPQTGDGATALLQALIERIAIPAPASVPDDYIEVNAKAV